MLISEALTEGSLILGKGLALDAELILAETLGVEREKLFTLDDFVDDFWPTYKSMLLRRKTGEPLAYILGYKIFCDLKFKVTAKTLIPRPETEFMVEIAQDFIEKRKVVDILDVGTGCGAIGLSLAKKNPQIKLTLTDISSAALTVAKENARFLSLGNVDFVESDLLSGIMKDDFELITANLPYIGEIKNRFIEKNVENFEPKEALFGGEDGLSLYRLLFQQLQKRNFFNKKLQFLIGEFGFAQTEALINEIKKYFSALTLYLISDLNNIDRFFVLTKPNLLINIPHLNARKIS